MSLFCPINTVKPKEFHFTVTLDEEKQQKLIFQRLQPEEKNDI